jgi:hypothetical protein
MQRRELPRRRRDAIRPPTLYRPTVAAFMSWEHFRF